jgi:carboxylesterase type B
MVEVTALAPAQTLCGVGSAPKFRSRYHQPDYSYCIDPTRLVARSLGLRKPMIAVAINYRLNLFGFAASSDIVNAQPDGEIRGCNFGLSDQRTALKWVSQNISSFGGDPTRITIGGQSAGASSVHAHVLEAKYELGRPLFRRAIVQSAAVGTLGPLSLTEADAKWVMLCKYLNISMVSAGSRLALLSSIPPSKLLKATQDLGWMVFPLVVDGSTISTRADGRWKVCLGQKDTEPADSMQEEPAPICVLIGDTDVEVCCTRIPRSLWCLGGSTFYRLRC